MTGTKRKDSGAYRQQAQEARELARRFDQEEARNIFVQLAGIWSAMARSRAEDEALLPDPPGQDQDPAAQ